MEPEPQPPDAQRILRRIWVLACVSARGFVEGEDDMIGRERTRREMLAWLRSLPLAGELEDDERAAIEAPIGQLGQQRTIDCGWRSEGIVVLLLSLGLGEIGAIDRQHEDPRALVDAAAYLEPDAASMLDRVRVRPADELDAYADVALRSARRPASRWSASTRPTGSSGRSTSTRTSRSTRDRYAGATTASS